MLDNCLIGFAIKPAAVKNATKVSASSVIPNEEPNAKYATKERDIETRNWIIGVARLFVASSFRF